MRKPSAEDWVRIHKVLYSCKTSEQLDIAFNWCLRYINHLWDKADTFCMMSLIYKDVKLMTNEVKIIRETKGWK